MRLQARQPVARVARPVLRAQVDRCRVVVAHQVAAVAGLQVVAVADRQVVAVAGPQVVGVAGDALVGRVHHARWC